MQCPSCGFQNLPGLEQCARCLSTLVFGQVDVQPYRASDRWALLRRWRLRGRLRWRERWAAIVALLQSGLSRVGYRPMRTAGGPGALRVVGYAAASIIPGLGLMLAGERRRGRILLCAYVAALACSFVFMSWAWSLFLAVVVGLHAYAIVSCLFLGEPFVDRRRAIFMGLCVFAGLQFGLYPAASWVIEGVARFEPVAGGLRGEVLREGDVLMVQGRWLAPENYSPGDVVSYRISGQRGPGWYSPAGVSIDRILALPGDRVIFKGGILTVNGQAVPLGRGTLVSIPPAVAFDVTVPEGTCFIYPSLLMARHGHLDAGRASEFDAAIRLRISVVPRGDILGRVIRIVSPPQRFGRL